MAEGFRITNLILKGYDRLKLRDINYINYKPKQLTQLILGTNGSGKSSLIEELSFLPANSSQYSKEGFKEVYGTDGKNEYYARSDFTGKQYHTFKIKAPNEEWSENLNVSGNLTAQLELVKQYFGITPEIHGLMIGKIKFSQMSISERRNWFTKLSVVDYTYAIKEFRRYSEIARDIQGALKLARSRLASESMQLVDTQDEKELRDRIQEFKRDITLLIEMKPELKDIPFADGFLEDIVNGFELFSDMVINEEDFIHKQNLLKKLNDKQNIQEHIRNELLDALRECEQDYSIISSVGDGLDVVKLKEEVSQLETSLVTANKIYSDEEDCVVAINVLNTIKDKIEQACMDLPINKGTYSTDTYNVLVSHKTLLFNKQKEITLLINKTEASIQEQLHLKEHDLVTCPMCEHTFSKLFDQELLNRLYSNLKELEITYDNYDKTLEETNAKIKEFVDYGQSKLQINNALSLGNGIIDFVLKEIADTNMLNLSPARVPQFLYERILFVKENLSVVQSEKLLKEKKEIVKQLELLGAKKLDDVKSRLESYSNKLVQLDDNITRVTKLRDYVVNRLARYEDWLSWKDFVINTSSQLESYMENETKALFRNLINDSVIRLQGLISRYEKRIYDVDKQLAVVADLNKQVEKYEKELKAYDAIIDALSPTNGLIAEGLKGFINRFVLQMNSFIGKIWSYPLRIAIVGDLIGDLDYKLELYVGDNPKPIKDIREASTGIKEVIDLTFRIVALSYLGLKHVPLFLDEFGANFDATHRRTSIDVITNLLRQSGFTQVFIISHYVDAYAMITEAETMVLCDENVVIPEGMTTNKNVSFVESKE